MTDKMQDEKMPELLPCPFCGNEKHWYAINIEKGFRIKCGECDASAWLATTEELAIKGWNTRDDLHQSTVKELHAARVVIEKCGALFKIAQFSGISVHENRAKKALADIAAFKKEFGG